MTAMVVHLFKQYLGYILVNLAPGFYMEYFYRLSSLFTLKSFLSSQCIPWDIFFYYRLEGKLTENGKNKFLVLQNISSYAVYLVNFISRFKVICSSQRGGVSKCIDRQRDLDKCIHSIAKTLTPKKHKP